MKPREMGFLFLDSKEFTEWWILNHQIRESALNQTSNENPSSTSPSSPSTAASLKCKFCKKSFRHAQTLQQHLDSKHKKEMKKSGHSADSLDSVVHEDWTSWINTLSMLVDDTQENDLLGFLRRLLPLVQSCPTKVPSALTLTDIKRGQTAFEFVIEYLNSNIQENQTKMESVRQMQLIMWIFAWYRWCSLYESQLDSTAIDRKIHFMSLVDTPAMGILKKLIMMPRSDPKSIQDSWSSLSAEDSETASQLCLELSIHWRSDHNRSAICFLSGISLSDADSPWIKQFTQAVLNQPWLIMDALYILARKEPTSRRPWLDAICACLETGDWTRLKTIVNEASVAVASASHSDTVWIEFVNAILDQRQSAHLFPLLHQLAASYSFFGEDILTNHHVEVFHEHLIQQLRPGRDRPLPQTLWNK